MESNAVERIRKYLKSLAGTDPLLSGTDPLLSEKIARAFQETIATAVSDRIASSLAERDSAGPVAEVNDPSSSRVSRCVDGPDSAGPVAEGGFATETRDSPSDNLPLGSCDCEEYAPVEEAEFETCKSHWSELRSTSDVAQQLEIVEANREAFRQFRKKWPNGFFQEVQFDLELQGEKIAEGVQGEIYIYQGCVWKVFKLEDASLFLEKQLPLGLYQNHIRIDLGRYYCWVHGARLFEDGRIAFQMWRYWGDLRRLIDLRMQDNNFAGRPFSYCVGYRLMWEIACGMRNLQERNIPHRDLKASNVLIMPCTDNGVSNHCPRHSNEFSCVVADYECSIGVMGTKFWRAPEILRAVKEKSVHGKQELFSESTDVYSYAVTCYEILTGKIPFDGLKAYDYEAVYSGRVKLEWPEDIDPQIEALLEQCCHLQPSERPTFKEVCERFHNIWKLFQPGEIPGLYSILQDIYSLLQSVNESSREMSPDLKLILPGLQSGLYGVHSVLQGAQLHGLVLSNDNPRSSDDPSCCVDDCPCCAGNCSCSSDDNA